MKNSFRNLFFIGMTTIILVIIFIFISHRIYYYNLNRSSDIIRSTQKNNKSIDTVKIKPIKNDPDITFNSNKIKNFDKVNESNIFLSDSFLDENYKSSAIKIDLNTNLNDTLNGISEIKVPIDSNPIQILY